MASLRQVGDGATLGWRRAGVTPNPPAGAEQGHPPVGGGGWNLAGGTSPHWMTREERPGHPVVARSRGALSPLDPSAPGDLLAWGVRPCRFPCMPLNPETALAHLHRSRHRLVARYDRTISLDHLAHCPTMAGTPWHRGTDPELVAAPGQGPPAAPTPPAAALVVDPGAQLAVMRIDGRRRVSLRELPTWLDHGSEVHLGIHEVQGHSEVHVTDTPQTVPAHRTATIESRVRLHLHPGFLGALVVAPGDQVLVIVEPGDLGTRRVRIRPFQTLFTTTQGTP